LTWLGLYRKRVRGLWKKSVILWEFVRWPKKRRVQAHAMAKKRNEWQDVRVSFIYFKRRTKEAYILSHAPKRKRTADVEMREDERRMRTE